MKASSEGQTSSNALTSKKDDVLGRFRMICRTIDPVLCYFCSRNDFHVSKPLPQFLRLVYCYRIPMHLHFQYPSEWLVGNGLGRFAKRARSYVKLRSSSSFFRCSSASATRFRFCAGVSFGSTTSFCGRALCRRGSFSANSRLTLLAAGIGFALGFGAGFSLTGTPRVAAASLSSTCSRSARLRVMFASRSCSLYELSYAQGVVHAVTRLIFRHFSLVADSRYENETRRVISHTRKYFSFLQGFPSWTWAQLCEYLRGRIGSTMISNMIVSADPAPFFHTFIVDLKWD